MEIDAKDFLKGLNLYDDRTFTAARRQMNANGEDLQRKAQELAPIDKGTLLGSAVTQTRTRSGQREIETLVGFTTPYAAKVHETMTPAPGATMRQGETTRNKPGNEFGEAGGHYLIRPLLGRMKIYTEALARRIRQVTR